MALRLWTVGYEGKTPEALAEVLLQNHIDTLVDIRWTPLSRKRGFSKSALWAGLMEYGISYRHVRQLGAPKQLRDDLSESSNFRKFSGAYRKHMLSQTEALEELTTLVRGGNVCLLCVEVSHEDCHRGILAEYLEKSGMQAIHLG